MDVLTAAGPSRGSDGSRARSLRRDRPSGIPDSLGVDPTFYAENGILFKPSWLCGSRLSRWRERAVRVTRSRRWDERPATRAALNHTSAFVQNAALKRLARV